MLYAALALATLCFIAFVLAKINGYEKYSGRAAYWTVVFIIIFIIGKSMEYFGR
jgi:hypothetical protein